MAAPVYQGSAGKSGTLGADPAVDLSGVGLANNDFMVAVCRAGGAIAHDGSWTTSPASQGANQPLFWRKWVTGDPTTFTFVTTGAVNSVVGIGVWRGVHTTSPVDDSDGIVGTGAMVCPSVDSAGLNRTLVNMAVKLQNTTFTFSGGGERFDALSSTQNFVYAGADEPIGNVSSGTRTATPASGAANGVAYLLVLRPATTEYTETHTLTGDGTVTRDVITITESKDLIGDGVITRAFAEAMSRDLVGDGVLTRSIGEAMSRDLTGDGVLTESHIRAVVRSFDLVGDGVLTRVLDLAESKNLTGDGVVDSTKQTVAAKSFDLTGDGVLDSSKSMAAVRSFDLVGDGVLTESHATNASRVFDLTGVGELVDLTITLPLDQIPTGDCPSDWTPNDGLRCIQGDVFFHEPPNEGDPVVGATVTLIRDSDGLFITTTLTDAAGHYSFPRDTNDPNTYHVEVRYADQQGLSEGGCVPGVCE